MTRRPLHSRIATAHWYFRTFRNWPEIFRNRLGRGMLRHIEYRNGPRLELNEGSGGIDVVVEVIRDAVYHRDFPGIPTDANILDLGANVGVFAVFAASNLAPHGRLLAVEGNPACAAMLARNLSAAGSANAEVIARVVSAEGSARNFWIGTNSLGSSLYPRDGHAKAMMQPLPAASVEFTELVDRLGRVDFVKMDIEGEEHALLWKCPPEIWGKIDRIAMEYHLGFDTGQPSDRDSGAIAARLQALGFTILRRQPLYDGATGYITAVRSALASQGATA